MSEISLQQLDEIIQKLGADIDKDLAELKDNVKLNEGARMGLAVLVQRIQAALAPTAPEIVAVAPTDTEEDVSGTPI